MGAFATIEGLEDPGQILWGKGLEGICDADLNTIALLLHSNDNTASLWSELDGVVENV